MRTNEAMIEKRISKLRRTIDKLEADYLDEGTLLRENPVGEKGCNGAHSTGPCHFWAIAANGCFDCKFYNKK